MHTCLPDRRCLRLRTLQLRVGPSAGAGAHRRRGAGPGGLSAKGTAGARGHPALHTPSGGEGRPETEDLREFGIGAQILRDLGATKLRLLTDRPRRIVGLEGFGIEVVETVPLSRPRQARKAS